MDVGSQSVKACVLDDQGRRRALHDAPCSLQHPASGWAEQDPQDWLTALATAVRGACAQAGVTLDDIMRRDKAQIDERANKLIAQYDSQERKDKFCAMVKRDAESAPEE